MKDRSFSRSLLLKFLPILCFFVETSVAARADNVVIEWNEAALQSIRDTRPAPTVLAQDTEQPSQDTINQRIAEIFKDALAQGVSTTPEGYRFTMGKVHYSHEQADEIKKYGDKAIAPLADYFSKNDFRAQQMAIHFLAIIGGPRVLKILSNVAEKGESPASRYTALLCLEQYPWQDIAEVVRRIAASDQHVNVKSQAQEILKRHATTD